MKVGDHVYTPRFCTVEIKAIFESRAEAAKAGWSEPAYYDANPEYGIAGRSIDMYHMDFVAYKK